MEDLGNFSILVALHFRARRFLLEKLHALRGVGSDKFVIDRVTEQRTCRRELSIPNAPARLFGLYQGILPRDDVLLCNTLHIVVSQMGLQRADISLPGA